MTNETEHYADAEAWLKRAEAAYAAEQHFDDDSRICLKFAEVHALLSTAADIDREASAEQRLAECVPDGMDSLTVSVRGR